MALVPSVRVKRSSSVRSMFFRPMAVELINSVMKNMSEARTAVPTAALAMRFSEMSEYAATPMMRAIHREDSRASTPQERRKRKIPSPVMPRRMGLKSGHCEECENAAKDRVFSGEDCKKCGRGCV